MLCMYVLISVVIVPTVVALCTFEELIDAYRTKRNLKHSNAKRDGRQMLTPYWPPVGPENYENFGPFKVETVSTEVLDDDKLMQRYELKYWDTKDLDEYSVQLFLCKDWDTLMETNHTTFRHDRYSSTGLPYMRRYMMAVGLKSVEPR